MENQKEVTTEEMKMVKTITRLVAIVIAVVLGIILISNVAKAFTKIDTGEIGIRRSWNKVTGELLEPGLNFIMPFRDDVIRFDLRVKKEEVAASAATSDMQDVRATIAVNYHVRQEDVMAMYQNIGDDDNLKDKIIAPSIQEVVKSTTAGYTAEDLLQKRGALKTEIDDKLSMRLSEYWIVVDDVSVVNLSFSAVFNEAIEAKQVVEQEALKAENELQKVRAEAQQRVTQAEAEAQAIRIQAEAITQQGGEDYVTLKFIEMMEAKWDGKMPQFVAGENGMILSLDNLISE